MNPAEVARVVAVVLELLAPVVQEVTEAIAGGASDAEAKRRALTKLAETHVGTPVAAEIAALFARAERHEP